MVFHTASEYSLQARDLVDRSTISKRLVLIHAAVAQGSILLIYLMGYLFDLLIADTGGLSGMGLRTLLSTAQGTLETVMSIALPFWQASLFFLGLRWARNRHAEPSHLFQGFRRFGPVLGYQLLYGLIFALVGLILVNPCFIIFLLTPFSASFLEEFAPLFDPTSTLEEVEAVLTEAHLESAAGTVLPFVILFGVVFLLIAIPLSYRLRLGQFAVMDNSRGGSALLSSFRATRKNWLPILKLDLHFWWYYALQFVCLFIANCDWLLPWLGVPLSMDKDAAFFLFFGLGTALQIFLLWQYQGQVTTSHALLYETYFPAPADNPFLEDETKTRVF